jgi:hypothetical protein
VELCPLKIYIIQLPKWCWSCIIKTHNRLEPNLYNESCCNVLLDTSFTIEHQICFDKDWIVDPLHMSKTTKLPNLDTVDSSFFQTELKPHQLIL